MGLTNHITGIILAGGKSLRMGRDKALLEFQGKKMIEYSIELLKPVCSQLLISTNQIGYEEFGIEMVADRYLECGPIGGLQAALSASKNEWNIVVGCDTPFLNQQLLELLLDSQDEFMAVVPSHENGMEPLAALYHRDVAAFFEKKIQKNEFELHRIIRTLKTNFLDVSDLLYQSPHLFDNLNSPQDL